MTAPAAFAIPGDIETLTGGYIYERRLLEALREIGHDVLHIRLSDGFPAPSDTDNAEAVAAMAAVGPARPLIIDGLVFGSIDTAGLAKVTAPIVAMIHHPLALESGLPDDTRAHLFRTERDNLCLAAHVFVPSRHTRSILVETYRADPARITIIRPGVDRASGAPHPTEPPLILSAGILHPRKGHDILIEALARLRHLDWRAIIVGTAWDRSHAADLQQMVDRLGLGDRLRLAGRVSGAELQHLYRSASIFALATRYEGYGIVFEEAMIHGLPVVSCRTGAVPDTVPAEAGVLVPPDDPDAFSDALESLLRDPVRRHSLAAAARRASAGFPDWRQQAHLAGSVLDMLAGNAAARPCRS